MIRFVTFCMWALAIGSGCFWVLQHFGVSADEAANAAAPMQMPASAAPSEELTSKVATVLGAKSATPDSAASMLAAQQARFQLVGVLTQGAQKGAALIAVDGKPAKPYAVGATLDADLAVIAVAPRSASIGKSNLTAFTLTLPNMANGGASSSLQK